MDTHYDVFKGELLKDEKIIWSGQPNPNIHFSGIDVFLVPFSIMWGGFAIFWEFGVITSGAPFFFMLWGIPFVVIGVFFMIGRFIYKSHKKRKTYYGVTNERVISIIGKDAQKVQANFIKDIPAISKSIKGSGNGTIKFGNASFMSSMYGNTGMELFGGFYGQDVLTFYDIDEAGKVYDLVNEKRRER